MPKTVLNDDSVNWNSHANVSNSILRCNDLAERARGIGNDLSRALSGLNKIPRLDQSFSEVATNQLYDGWYFLDDGQEQHYVRVGGRQDDKRIYGPDESVHGVSIESVKQGAVFYRAPSPASLLALCATASKKDES